MRMGSFLRPTGVDHGLAGVAIASRQAYMHTAPFCCTVHLARFNVHIARAKLQV